VGETFLALLLPRPRALVQVVADLRGELEGGELEEEVGEACLRFAACLLAAADTAFPPELPQQLLLNGCCCCLAALVREGEGLHRNSALKERDFLPIATIGHVGEIPGTSCTRGHGQTGHGRDTRPVRACTRGAQTRGKYVRRFNTGGKAGLTWPATCSPTLITSPRCRRGHTHAYLHTGYTLVLHTQRGRQSGQEKNPWCFTS